MAANQNENLVFGWTPQSLGASAGQSGYAQPGNGLPPSTVSAAGQVSAGNPSPPVKGNAAADILTNPGYGSAPAASMQLLATTGAAGYTLVNGTGTILSWTAPNDGAMHRVLVLGTLRVITTETGGAINVSFNAPDGTAGTTAIFSASHGAGVFGPDKAGTVLAQAGTTVAVTQGTALTAGSATLWAEIWGS